jgi:methylated-DNA-[protein]-cysteine S-methyltransferase
MIRRTTVPTPLGSMLALASDRGLVALEFDAAARHLRLHHRLMKFLPGQTIEDAGSPFFDQARAWLDGYFAGERADIGDLALDQYGDPFERTVWDALVTIPAGTTESYGGIATRIGAPGAARAVGLANGANPIAIIVPCHRVIGSDGSLTGYGGGLDRKRWLLAHESRWRKDLLRGA